MFQSGDRREYQHALVEEGAEIHALEYFGIWIGLNLMVILWVVFTLVLDRYWLFRFLHSEFLLDEVYYCLCSFAFDFLLDKEISTKLYT